jgi:membrane protease YdiL (CAAX protease family)
MRNLLRSLPLGAEFLIVIVMAFGVSIVASLFAAAQPPHGALAAEPRLWGLILHETIVLVVLGLFLYVRDWTPKRLGLLPGWTDVLWSVVLIAGVYLAFYAAWYGLAFVSPKLLHATAQVKLVSSGVSPVTIVAMVLVNPFFEEVFVAGYVITALKGVRSATFAINVSVAIRLLYHLYQGVTGILAIIPMGLIFGYWFARKGRLWPLIGAHAIMNLVGLLYYLRH